MKYRNYSQPYIEYDQRYYSGCMSYEPIPAIEREKYQITLQIDWAKEKKDYKEVIRLLKGLASICHSQAKEKDAYWLEHEAFLYEQELIYQQANISVDAFADIPYVEKLKEVLCEAADWAMTMEQIDYAVSFKQLNARICRVQGQERDAYLLDCASYQLLEKAGRVHDWGRIPDAGMEAQCLKQLARKYGTKLSEDKGAES